MPSNKVFIINIVTLILFIFVRHNDEGVNKALEMLRKVKDVSYDYSQIKPIGSNPGKTILW